MPEAIASSRSSRVVSAVSQNQVRGHDPAPLDLVHQNNVQRLAGLSSHCRAAVTNMLEKDEPVEFVFPGVLNSALVLTDVRAIVPMRSTRLSTLTTRDVAFDLLEDVTFSPSDSGGLLMGHLEGRSETLLRVATFADREMAVRGIPIIRSLIEDA